MTDRPTTALCHATADDVYLRGRSLTRELVGQRTFTEVMYLHVVGREPTAGQVAVLDGCLVTLMEHGMTPTAVTARLTYTGAPEAMQAAVAAGLMGVGSLFAGTMDGCGRLLARLVAAPELDTEAAAVAREVREAGDKLPGFGHPLHKPVDPRAVALLELAERHGLRGRHCDALAALGAAAEATWGRSLPPNATGAIAAVLADADVPVEILRGFALISRAAGLVAHLREEQQRPTLRALWQAAEAAVPYAPEDEP